MIDNLGKYRIGIAIGVRYRANFSLEDQLGNIVDRILYKKDSFFGPKVFTGVINKVNEKILINDNSKDHLVINNSNIILEINYGETFQRSDLDVILKGFNKEIIEGVMKKYRVTEINRVGLIFRYLFKMENLADTFIDKTIGATLEGINDINLSFSKKIPVPESLAKKGVNDYHNAIFNVIKRADKQELFMSVDYQKYFDPFLTSASQIEFEHLVKKVESFNSGNYLDWLNKNYGTLNEKN